MSCKMAREAAPPEILFEIDRDPFDGMIERILLAVNIRPVDFDGSRGTFGVVGQVDDDVVQLVFMAGSLFVGSHADAQDADLVVLELERVVPGIGFERIKSRGCEGARVVFELDLDDLKGMAGNVLGCVQTAGRTPAHFAGLECGLLNLARCRSDGHFPGVQIDQDAIHLVLMHGCGVVRLLRDNEGSHLLRVDLYAVRSLRHQCERDEPSRFCHARNVALFGKAPQVERLNGWG